MNKKYNITKNQIMGGIVLILTLCVVCLLVYKAQLADSFDKKIKATLMWEHKENYSVELSANKPSLTQVFTCTVPKLKTLRMECKGKKINPNTYIEVSLTEPGSGKEYYHKKVRLSTLVKSSKKKIKFTMKKSIANSENKQLIFNISLIDAEDSVVKITANYKPGIVTSFDGDQNNKTNVIYSIHYSNTKHLKRMFAILCVLLLVAALVSYYLIIVRKKSVEQFYIPIALLMGLIFQCVIVVHGVPDEPWHMDTAYKLSNDLLFVNDSEEQGVIMKRHCDVIMSDMLANGVESNSYYQLLENTFEKPENTELVMVNYVDSSNLVPDFIFLPTAIGISIGRLLGLSAMLTLQLGRICNLIVFVLLVWVAINRIPYGKNVMAALGFTPIALQQAASASYDPVITGMIFLYAASVMRLAESEKGSKRDVITVAIIVVLLALVKGGVYLPLVCLLLIIFAQNNVRKYLKGIKKRWIVVGVGIACLAVVGLLYKFVMAMSALIITEIDETNLDSLYSLSYIIKHPLDVLYLYWNTLIKSGAGHFTGMLGGKLGWHDIQISWLLIIILFVSLILLVHVERDTYKGSVKSRICIGASCLVSILLIMLSMLFACTTLGNTHIVGIQGRYYLPLAPLLFMISANSMMQVNHKQCYRIWFTLVFVNIMVALQFLVAIM